MNLYLLRHGIAADPSLPDFADDAERPLTPKGKHRLRQIVKAMRALDLSFNAIISSPYLRAKQTAEIVVKSLKRRRQLQFSGDLAPDGNPKSLIQQLNEMRPKPKNILLVGHEPYLSKLISLLTAGNTAMEIDLKKGGLCRLETDALRYAKCATFAYLLTPGQMALMIGEADEN
jgi:phosphohistidine phosphatase